MLDIENLASIAYDAYGATTNYKNYQGNPMPDWEDLPPKIKEAWIASTNAVINAFSSYIGT